MASVGFFGYCRYEAAASYGSNGLKELSPSAIFYRHRRETFTARPYAQPISPSSESERTAILALHHALLELVAILVAPHVVGIGGAYRMGDVLGAAASGCARSWPRSRHVLSLQRLNARAARPHPQHQMWWPEGVRPQRRRW